MRLVTYPCAAPAVKGVWKQPYEFRYVQRCLDKRLPWPNTYLHNCDMVGTSGCALASAGTLVHAQYAQHAHFEVLHT
jgi:hypothetical protein